MENRFGFKDLLTLLLLSLAIVLIVVSMYGYDRQWDKLITIEQRLADVTQDLARVQRNLSSVNERLERPPVAAVQPAPGTQPGVVNPHVPSGSEPVTALQAPASTSDAFDGLRAAEKQPDFARGDWLVESFNAKPSKITPLLSTDIYGRMVQARVQECLVMQDPRTLEDKPLIARSWQIEDNTAAYDAYRAKKLAEGRTEAEIAADPQAPDAVRITYQLRQNVTFSDGTPLTADDVVFTFDWTMNKKVEAPRDRAYFDRIRAVEKLGPHEVVFRFREPYFEAKDLSGGMAIMPKHFYSKLTPEEFNKQPGMLMGSGPYRMENPTSWRPGEPLQLVRNERYWGEPATFDRLVYRVIENEAAEQTAFRNGEIDMYAPEPEQLASLQADQQLMARVNEFKLEHLRIGYGYIAWNQKRKGQATAFADKRIRQAMTMLADRQGIVDQILLGYGRVASGPFHYLGEQADPKVEAWPYDVSRAKALLKEAGFEDRNGDGVVESASGVPLRFKLTYPSGSDSYQRIVLFLKDSFARGGVALEPDPTDWPILVEKLDQRDFDAVSLGWSGGIENDIYQMFHSSQISDNGDNFMHYKNPELDKALEAARRTLDKDKRMELWRQCHRILHEDQPYTFLTRRAGIMFVDKRIRNVEPTRIGFNYVSLWMMPLEWYVPKDLQKHGK